jgi:hypothetical protein
MFTITDARATPASHETDRDGADAAYLRFVEEGFVLDPGLCNSSDTVLVRADEQVTITYSSR